VVDIELTSLNLDPINNRQDYFVTAPENEIVIQSMFYVSTMLNCDYFSLNCINLIFFIDNNKYHKQRKKLNIR
jgi:hypothetical protein